MIAVAVPYTPPRARIASRTRTSPSRAPSRCDSPYQCSPTGTPDTSIGHHSRQSSYNRASPIKSRFFSSLRSVTPIMSPTQQLSPNDDDGNGEQGREFSVMDLPQHVRHRVSLSSTQSNDSDDSPSSSLSSVPPSPPPSPLTLVAQPYCSQAQLPVCHHIRSDSVRRRQLKQAESALLSLQSLPTKLGLQFDVSDDQPFFGLPITYVEPNSCVGDCGVEAGDILIELNGTRIISMDDLQQSLDGLIAGDVVPIIVAREGQDLLFQLTVEARHADMKHVRTLHALLDEATLSTDTPTTNDGNDDIVGPTDLSLADFLDIPQYRHVLLSYMRSVRCEESVLFLLCERAFHRIPRIERARMLAMAYLMYDLFIDEASEVTLNIDSTLRKSIQSLLFADSSTSAISGGGVSPLLYHSIAQEIYAMCETDVFKRFLYSEAFSACNQWALAVDDSIGARHRRDDRFEPIPYEEYRVELVTIVNDFVTHSPLLVISHRLGLRKYKHSFYGKDFYRYLTNQKHESKVRARELCQRCVDGFALVQCHANNDDGANFSMDALYHASIPIASTHASNDSMPVSALYNAHSKQSVFVLSSPPVSRVTSGYVFVHGVYVMRVWLTVDTQSKRLSLYHDHTADTVVGSNSAALFDVSLKHSKCQFHQSHRAHCAYFHFAFKQSSAARKSLDLRVESVDEGEVWLALFKQCGATVTVTVAEGQH